MSEKPAVHIRLTSDSRNSSVIMNSSGAPPGHTRDAVHRYSNQRSQFSCVSSAPSPGRPAWFVATTSVGTVRIEQFG